MRPPALLLTGTLLMTTLVAFVPTGTAVSHCTTVLNDLTTTDCRHFICLFRSSTYHYGYEYERCKFSEDNLPHPCGPTALCEPCTCPPLRYPPLA